MNTRPPAVTKGPPAPGVPRYQLKGMWAIFLILPSGTSQRIFLLTRSTAVSAAQGGVEQGTPNEDSNGSTWMTKGESGMLKLIMARPSTLLFSTGAALLFGTIATMVGTRFVGT